MKDNIKVTVRFLFWNNEHHFLFRHGKEYVFKMPGNWMVFGLTGRLEVGDVVYVKDNRGAKHPVIITVIESANPKELRDHKRIYKPSKRIKFTTHVKLPVHAPMLDANSIHHRKEDER